MIINNNVSIEELYEIILMNEDPKKIFKDNLDLWKKFYYNREKLISNNITNKKLFSIIKFLLEHESGEINEYFQDGLLQSLIRIQEKLVFISKTEKNIEYSNINTLFSNLENYTEISTFLTNYFPKLKKDNINLNAVKKYQNSSLKIETIDSLILNIYGDFFRSPPELVLKTIEFIKKQITTLTIPENNKKPLYNNLVEHYITKLIPIKYFIGSNIKQDQLINLILEGKIENEKIIYKLIDELEPKNLLELFNNDIFQTFEFLNRLEKIDEVKKQVIINKIMDKFLTKEDFSALLPLITKKYENIYWRRILNNNKFETLINNTLGDSTTNLSFETINYLLDKEYVNDLFLTNLIETVTTSKNSFTETELETILTKLSVILKKYNLTNLYNSLFDQKENTINFDVAINLLNQHLSQNYKLSLFEMQAVIKSIIKNMLKELEIENVEVYFIKHPDNNGEYYVKEETPPKNVIHININLLNDCITKTNLFEKIKVLITMLHEMRHCIKEHDKRKDINDIETYEMLKEEVLSDYNPKYYNENYKYYHEEIDARIESYNMLTKFLETYLPHHLNSVQDSIISNFREQQKIKEARIENDEVTIIKRENVPFNLAFDTIIRYNPDILKQNPILNLEYHEDGTLKSYEEILENRLPSNQKLIDEILKKRYPPDDKKLDPKHTK